jgi:hypothetical protein
MMQETNPYAPPKVPVADRPDSHGLNRRSVLLMFVFLFATFGFYYVIWFFRRRTKLNRLDSPRKLALWPLLLFSAVWVIQIVVGLVAGETPVDEALGTGTTLLLQLLQIVVGIVMIVQCFKIKDIIEDHAAPPVGADLFVERVSLSGLLTFFFSIFYLQWAINRYVVLPPRNERRPQCPGSPPAASAWRTQ